MKYQEPVRYSQYALCMHSISNSLLTSNMYIFKKEFPKSVYSLINSILIY